ncbi:MAG: hypothetical protein FJW20_00945 [Acidimicrobiia bacterium]|nr:hypothetical protein [Acidimicrobiia bacterium]
MTTLLWQFSYLQVLDFLTTMAFLIIGVQEGNPLVRLALELAPSPVAGLVLVKVAALGLGLACMRMGKAKLLSRINVMFAVVVAWNLVALIAGAARGGIMVG